MSKYLYSVRATRACSPAITAWRLRLGILANSDSPPLARLLNGGTRTNLAPLDA